MSETDRSLSSKNHDDTEDEIDDCTFVDDDDAYCIDIPSEYEKHSHHPDSSSTHAPSLIFFMGSLAKACDAGYGHPPIGDVRLP